MKTTHKDTPILGSAAFGTMDGLQVHGNGWLAGARSSFGVFEFALGRARDGDLHKTQPLTPVLFRRRCETAEGQGFEL